MNAFRVGIGVVITTIASYAIVTLERQQALKNEEDRVTLQLAAKGIGGDMNEIKRRVAWEVERKDLAHKGWQKAVATGTAADVENANRYIERLNAEIKEEQKLQAAQDEKSRERREEAEKEQHKEALAAIERNYYMHFALIWLLAGGSLLVLGSLVTRRSQRQATRSGL